MDISLLQTFLEVARHRHFGHAAEVLCVTQSAVSGRIKQLESTLSVSLFHRRRNDIRLTAAGERLLRHAETAVLAWQRARQELSLEPQATVRISLGFPLDLWPSPVRPGIALLRQEAEDLALRLEVLPVALLVDRLITGVMDLVVTFEPPMLPEFTIRPLPPLVLMYARAEDKSGPAVQVDWGALVALRQSRESSDALPAPIQVNAGFLAGDLLADHGGAAFLGKTTIEQGGFRPDASVAPIERPVFAVYRSGHAYLEQLEVVTGALARCR
ncbi:MAG: LysR family transcriptional regulator [Chromatiales bacterium]|nr:LysR family transcriptional regulator [Gammaproteobacteria bacterium]MCB1876328.1 LysR family transcriptional regulator [Chromatiales bacterium]